jgi:hypothetical protein
LGLGSGFASGELRVEITLIVTMQIAKEVTPSEVDKTVLSTIPKIN